MSVTRSQPSVLFEDRDLIVLNKPAGLTVHGGAGVRAQPTLTDWLLKKYPEIRDVGENPLRPGLVHRLDADTSGLMVVARNTEAFRKLKRAFQARTVQKKYLALVHGRPTWSKKTVNLSLHRGPRGLMTARHPHDVAKMTVARREEFRTAVTELQVQKRFKNFSLLEASLQTGRTHQIRVHLRAIGYPLAGDRLYASVTAQKAALNQLGLKRQFLHAALLSFIHPRLLKKISFEAPLPQDLREALSAAKKA